MLLRDPRNHPLVVVVGALGIRFGSRQKEKKEITSPSARGRQVVFTLFIYSITSHRNPYIVISSLYRRLITQTLGTLLFRNDRNPRTDIYHLIIIENFRNP